MQITRRRRPAQPAGQQESLPLQEAEEQPAQKPVLRRRPPVAAATPAPTPAKAAARPIRRLPAAAVDETPPPPVDPEYVEPEIQVGEGFVEARVPFDALTGPKGASLAGKVVTLMRAEEVPVIGTLALLGVKSGVLHMMPTTDGKTFVYRWRA